MSQEKTYDQILLEVPDGVFFRFPLCQVNGVPLMEPIVDNWGKVETFQARPDDLLIATYPKAGTTWMQEIVDSILNDGDLKRAKRAPIHVRSPFLEIASPPPVPSGVQILENTPSPRLVKTHLPYQLVPKSFWEQNCKDPKREIRKVMKFLGKDLPDEVLDKIHQHTTFQAMKENPMANYTTVPTSLMDQSISPFMRKGEVADWKNHFTGAQTEMFDTEYLRRMKETDLKFRCNI
ncbi:hypothetical protein FKM82_029416 [Ascaphus truei]